MDIQKEMEAFKQHLTDTGLVEFAGYGFEVNECDEYLHEPTLVAWECWLIGSRRAKAQAVPEQVLDAPARVGSGTFQKGVKWSTVIGAAQRHYERDQHDEAPAICIRDQLRVASGHSVVVPKEPTEEMIMNGLLVISTEVGKYDIQKEVRMIWEKMIEAQEQKG